MVKNGKKNLELTQGDNMLTSHMRKLMESVHLDQEVQEVGMHPDNRKVTNKLHEMMDVGDLDPRIVADSALSYMSEDDVADMARSNELLWDDNEEDEDDGDGDERNWAEKNGSDEREAESWG